MTHEFVRIHYELDGDVHSTRMPRGEKAAGMLAALVNFGACILRCTLEEPAPEFGDRWRSLMSSEDDWSEECNSGPTAFDATVPSHTVRGWG